MDTQDTTVKAIIFDCFGVLTVDTQQVYYDQLDRERRHEFHYLNHMRDQGFIGQDEYFYEVGKLVEQPAATVRNNFLNHHHLNEELIVFIRDKLKKKYKIGMLSNIGRGWIDSFFGKEMLHELFDAVVLSSEEGVTKPHPMIYEHAAEKLGVAPGECLMIDDVQRNCDGAEAVGMRAMLFRGTTDTIKYLQKLLH